VQPIGDRPEPVTTPAEEVEERLELPSVDPVGRFSYIDIHIVIIRLHDDSKIVNMSNL
jgi:hypothetical protein